MQGTKHPLPARPHLRILNLIDPYYRFTPSSPMTDKCALLSASCSSAMLTSNQECLEIILIPLFASACVRLNFAEAWAAVIYLMCVPASDLEALPADLYG